MRAFTLIELIFVIVIIGIMAGVGFSSFKPSYLLDDTNFVAGKIKEAQFLGIGYEHYKFNENDESADFDSGCIKIEKDTLSETATKKDEVTYTLHVDIIKEQGDGDDNNIICFDSKGRPHHTDFKPVNLLTTQTIFKFSYSGKDRFITIEPITGYIIISY